jgi:hypothetical protein
LIALAGSASAQKKRRPVRKPAAPAAETKTKVAEGKYLLSTETARVFEEPWVLSRTRLGYQLDEQWVFYRNQGDPTVIDVVVDMVAGFRPLQIQIGTNADSVRCKIALQEFSCETKGQTRKLETKPPYDYFSPSPWILSNVVRRVKKDPSVKTTVNLVRIDGADASGPRLSSFVAEVQYVGDDQTEVGGQKFTASIYELHAESVIPGMLVWVSPEGIVLAMQDSTHPDQRMELAELKFYGKL